MTRRKSGGYRERMLRRAWRFISDLETIRGLTGLAGPFGGSVAASRRLSRMADGFLEDPFEPMAWFFGAWLVIGNIAVSMRFVWSMIPASKFHAMVGEVRDLSVCFSDQLHYSEELERHIAEPELRVRLFILKQKLDDLKIPTPSTNYFVVGEWYQWLPRLASWAETKNLYEARNYDP